MRLPEGCRNSILLYKIMYFPTSWDFAGMVSKLEAYLEEKYKKFMKNQRFLGSNYKDYFLLPFLAVVMVLFVVVMSKANLERIPK